MNLLFVYGTLKESKVQQVVIGREVQGAPDTLEGYGLGQITVDGEVYPLAEPRVGEKIIGQVLEVSDEELKMIDQYETEVYERIRVRLVSGAKAWIYRKRMEFK